VGCDQGGGEEGDGMKGHVQELTKLSGCTADVRTLGGFQSIRWKISDVVTDIGPI
jgi:hypothetical protein